ncbi:hypothetical protein F4782DRAFT_533338 [Xylaria castorea]|nr:hypothetical protein F4782DRAFT_533338 [Xylaria castorea]
MPKPNETIAIIITFLILAGFVAFYLCTLRFRDPSSREEDDEDEGDGDDGDSLDLSAYAAHPDLPRPPPAAAHAFRGEPGFGERGIAASASSAAGECGLPAGADLNTTSKSGTVAKNALLDRHLPFVKFLLENDRYVKD